MTSVANHKANVVFLSKLQCLTRIRCVFGSDGVADVVAKRAWGFRGREWIAAVIGEERGHHRRGRREMGLGKVPVIPENAALRRIVGCSVTDAGDRYNFDQASTNGLVEAVPSLGRWPARVSWETITGLRRWSRSGGRRLIGDCKEKQGEGL